ncbi:hypothetical protein TWF103_009199 [Orbilia oligospora]|nr:hypothetical protein TWF103_009199 [Orbilia oligospora]
MARDISEILLFLSSLSKTVALSLELSPIPVSLGYSSCMLTLHLYALYYPKDTLKSFSKYWYIHTWLKGFVVCTALVD